MMDVHTGLSTQSHPPVDAGQAPQGGGGRPSAAGPRRLLVAAGGTGGHIMPGLAVAQALRNQGWEVSWLGDPSRMEGAMVPSRGFELLPVRFGGLRGKGWRALFSLPYRLLRACWQTRRHFRRQHPDVVLGMGGYAAFPAGLMARLGGVPLVVHEQNARAGTANRWLAKWADAVLAGFPGALPQAVVVGNPLRDELLRVAPPAERYAARQGPLRLLVLGGSLGAAALNQLLPAALARLAPEQRPQVVHQAGEAHLAGLRAAYAAVSVQADCVAFIEDMAGAMSQADVVICRAGAMTVAEVAAVGVAALFIPLPHAIDDHQTANARYLTDCGAAWRQAQAEASPAWLADWLGGQTRASLADMAVHARNHAQPEALARIVQACVAAAGRPAA